MANNHALWLPVLPDITSFAWAMALMAALVIGLSKAGIKGIAVINVTLMALAFGARESTGIVVPLLIVGDVMAVVYFHRHANWYYIRRFLPWVVFGILVGVVIGNDLDEARFKIWMAVLILISVASMYWWDRRKSKVVPTHWAFAGLVGTIAGISTMIGNLGGAFSNVYFLAMRAPKNEFIGTAAWLFLIINVLKLPFHIWAWHTITPETLWVDLWLLPGVFLGMFVGVRLVNRIREGFYRKMILVLTALGAILIVLR